MIKKYKVNEDFVIGGGENLEKDTELYALTEEQAKELIAEGKISEIVGE